MTLLLKQIPESLWVEGKGSGGEAGEGCGGGGVGGGLDAQMFD